MNLRFVRTYARQKLTEDDARQLRRRHARHFVDRLAKSTEEWETTATDRWLARYGADADNLRVALDWSFGPNGDVGIGLELIGHSHVIAAELGLMLEHRRWVIEGLRHIDDNMPKPVVARLLSWRSGDVKEFDDSTDYDDAMTAATIYRELGDVFNQAQMLMRAGVARLPEGPREGECHLQEACRLLRQRGPTKTLAQCLSALASARLFAADIAGAQSLHEEALAIQRNIADRSGDAPWGPGVRGKTSIFDG